MYTVKEAAKRMSLSEHTVRYYANEGLFPFLIRDKNNVRLFTDKDISEAETILCLKNANMHIKEIRHYMELCHQGDATITARLEMIQSQKAEVERQLAELGLKLEHLECKEAWLKNSLRSNYAN